MCKGIHEVDRNEITDNIVDGAASLDAVGGEVVVVGWLLILW